MDKSTTSYSVQDALTNKSIETLIRIACVLSPLGLLTWINNDLKLIWPWYVAILVDYIGLFLFLKFPKMPKSFSISIFFSQIITTLLAGVATTYGIVLQRIDSDFFGTFKYMALAVALIAPSPAWLGYTAILICLFVPPLQSLFLNPEIDAFSSHREPWVTIGYVILAFFILNYRVKSQKMQTELIEAKTNEKSLQDFAEVAVALRDLTNTPLQSLDLLTDMLKNETLKGQEASEYLSDITLKLNEIMYIFNENQKRLVLKRGYDQSNSLEVLRRKFTGPVVDISDKEIE